MGGFGRRQVEEESPLNVPWAPEAQALSNPKGWVQMLDYLKFRRFGIVPSTFILQAFA